VIREACLDQVQQSSYQPAEPPQWQFAAFFPP
jgi:hypothetical protein